MNERKHNIYLGDYSTSFMIYHFPAMYTKTISNIALLELLPYIQCTNSRMNQ
jgi:hypothetical protein